MKKYFIELMVIFVGISASFLVDEFREDLEIDKQVSKSLYSLQKELNNDIIHLENLIKNIENSDNQFSYILNLELSKSLKDSVLDKAWQTVTTPRGGKLNLSVFNAMEASGIIYKIDNDSIRGEILDLYQNGYERYHHVIDYDLTHIQKMDDIVLKNFSLRVDNTSWNLDWSKKSNIDQIVKNSELRNYIAANRGTKNIMKMRAKALIENINKVVNLIDTY